MTFWAQSGMKLWNIHLYDVPTASSAEDYNVCDYHPERSFMVYPLGPKNQFTFSRQEGILVCLDNLRRIERNATRSNLTWHYDPVGRKSGAASCPRIVNVLVEWLLNRRCGWSCHLIWHKMGCALLDWYDSTIVTWLLAIQLYICHSQPECEVGSTWV